MPKRMLIDASHPEETRVVVLDGNKVEEFDFESATRRPLKGNIYLAKVTRVEPSLQAAFVEYGGNRQGFLAFSEIHPDYYQIPVADRMALLEAQTKRLMAEDDFDAVDTATAPRQDSMLGAEQDDEPAQAAGEETRSEDAEAPEARDASDRGEHDDTEAETESEDEADEAGSAEAETRAFAGEGSVVIDASEQPVIEIGEAVSETFETAAAPEAAASEGQAVQAEATGVPQQHQRRDKKQWPRPPRRRQYKIQEVIKRRQILLVQVVKEERGTKGASLTTFLSLAGRYCVLMPNTPRGGGISRKITQASDRKRLKAAAQALELPEGMGLIIRTAGANRTKLEIKRDYEYLLRLWDTVRELTLKSNAPALVYEEGSLIKRAIRDLYNKDISEVQVDGDAGYRDAKDFMRMIMPSHAKNVKVYKESLPLFQRFQVESQLDAMFSPTVTLRSGGYIVINQTEALVSIDVNSGKATREHSIEETAYKTNLEAADEIARQLRLRDLAGLIVIDFIDMEDGKNDRNVEKRLHNAVKGDRARIQIGKISQFGLLEMSRQRLRAGVVASSTVTCPHCAGLGIIRSTESAALRLLRALDEEGQRSPGANISVKAPEDVSIYTLNHKRREIARIEEAYDLEVSFEPQEEMMGGSFELERTGMRAPGSRPKPAAVTVEAGFQTQPESEPVVEVEVEAEEETDREAEGERETTQEPSESRERTAQGAQGEGDGSRRRRRRRRRGGRGRGQPEGVNGASQEPRQQGHDGHRATQNQPAHDQPVHAEADASAETRMDEGEGEGEDDAGTTLETGAQGDGAGGDQHGQGQGDRKRRRRRRGRRGRRRDGEQGLPQSGNGEVQIQHAGSDDGSSESDGSYGSAMPAEPFTPAVMPNALSSPQWSLDDRGAETSAHRADREPKPEPQRFVAQEPEPETAVAGAVEQPSARERPKLPEAEPPREPRKGWWQRRFGG